MKASTTLMFIATVGVLCASGAVAHAKEDRIGFVDFQKVFEKSKVIQKLNAELERDLKSEQAAISRKRDSLESKKQAFEKKTAVMNDDVRTKKEEELLKEFKDLKRYANDKEEEFKRKGSGLMQNIMKELTDIVKEIGEKEGYTAIVERATGGVLYMATTADITDAVVEAYDKRNK